MKKCLLLTLCLVLLATGALAGTEALDLKQLSDSVALVYAKPEGVASIDVMDVYDMKVLTYTMEDETMPVYVLTVSYSDLLYDKDITDLGEEEIQQLVALTAYEADTYAHEVIEMEDGWPAVLVVYDSEAESDWVDAFTLIEGYLIQMHGFHTDFRALTEAEDRMAFTLLDSVDIVRTEPSEDEIAGMPNPMEEATEEAFVGVMGTAPVLPEDAQDIAYYQYSMGSGLVEVHFTSGGVQYVFGAQAGDPEDISGMFVTFETEQDVQIHDINGTLKINEGQQGVCQWYDEAAKVNYSLAALDGANADTLVALATALTDK